MDKYNSSIKSICGRYLHYKGNRYFVFCQAYDSQMKKFVLYQQEYGDKNFFIRPYEMFFETIVINGNATARFKNLEDVEADTAFNSLIYFIKNGSNIVIHTETNQHYYITGINQDKMFVTVRLMNEENLGGYLADFELANRLNCVGLVHDTKFKLIKRGTNTIDDNLLLKIGTYDQTCQNIVDAPNLEMQFNPCSIDLQIADSFQVARSKKIDPHSIEHISNVDELWRNVKLKNSKNGSSKYIKIHPGQTVLTHTKYIIKIPNDCAGKIEIKSTFARLALSITYGDFCNPGYCGCFPLEITNHGKHTAIIHGGDMMAQLVLIPLGSSTLFDYVDIATYQTKITYDDGLPYNFWKERSIKALKRSSGTQKIEDYYLFLRENGSPETQILAFKKRFDNTFLPFCQKRLNRETFKSNSGNTFDLNKLVSAYIESEEAKKKIFNTRWFSFVIAVFLAIVPVILQSILSEEIKLTYWMILAAGVISAIFLCFSIVLFLKKPKVFCTLDKIDVEHLERDVQDWKNNG